MPTLTKRSGSSSKAQKLLDRAVKLYPDYEWMVQLATPEVIEDYGDGLVLTGTKGNFFATFFILQEDPRKDTWIMMIASNIQEQIDGTR